MIAPEPLSAFAGQLARSVAPRLFQMCWLDDRSAPDESSETTPLLNAAVLQSGRGPHCSPVLLRLQSIASSIDVCQAGSSLAFLFVLDDGRYLLLLNGGPANKSSARLRRGGRLATDEIAREPACPASEPSNTLDIDLR